MSDEEFNEVDFLVWYESEVCTEECRKYFDARQEWAVEIYQDLFGDGIQDTYNFHKGLFSEYE